MQQTQTSEIVTVDIKIFGREFKIKCPVDKVSSLKEATKYVDDEMHVMREKEKSASNDILAIITALNLAHELILLKKHKTNLEDIIPRIATLKENVAAVFKKRDDKE